MNPQAYCFCFFFFSCWIYWISFWVRVILVLNVMQNYMKIKGVHNDECYLHYFYNCLFLLNPFYTLVTAQSPFINVKNLANNLCTGYCYLSFILQMRKINEIHTNKAESKFKFRKDFYSQTFSELLYFSLSSFNF